MTAQRKALGKGLEAIFANLGAEVKNPKTGEAIHEVEIAKVQPNPFQPRRVFAKPEIEELAESIKEKGLIQPILLRRHAGGFQVVAGERRLRAYQHLGKTTITAQVRDQVSDRDMMELALIENIQRVQLDPIEEALAYERLVNEIGLTHDEMARKMGKSRSAISNAMRLLKLEPEVQALLQAGKLSAGHGRALVGLPSKQQLSLAHKLAEEGLNVRAAEAGKKPSAPAKLKPIDANTQAFLDHLREVLGTPVLMKGKPNKGVLEIPYFGREDLDRLTRIFELGQERMVAG